MSEVAFAQSRPACTAALPRSSEHDAHTGPRSGSCPPPQLRLTRVSPGRARHRRRHRRIESGAAGRHGDRGRSRNRPAVHRHHRRQRRVPPLEHAAGRLQVSGGARRFRDRRHRPRRVARRPARDDAVYAEAGAAHGNGDGDRRVAARRHALVADRRQRRSPADGGSAAAGAQLAGTGDDRQGDHRQRRHRPSGRARRSVSAQPRWPADHAAGGRIGIRPAEVQPRSDRRIPDCHQPVRHFAGAIDRHPGAGGVAVRDQPDIGQLLRVLP